LLPAAELPICGCFGTNSPLFWAALAFNPTGYGRPPVGKQPKMGFGLQLPALGLKQLFCKTGLRGAVKGTIIELTIFRKSYGFFAG